MSADLSYRLQTSESEVIELCPHPGRSNWGVLVVTQAGVVIEVDLTCEDMEALAFASNALADQLAARDE